MTLNKNPKLSIAPDYFIPEKTNDVFKEVKFVYERETWYGVLPKFLEKQGLDLSDEEFDQFVEENFVLLNPENRAKWIVESDKNWANRDSATYLVLKALYSGKWECRVCGPVPRVNPQPAARLRDIKKRGYIIGSQRRPCQNCRKKTMHDICVMLPNIVQRFTHGNELRKPISEILKARIKRVLGHKEVCFNVVRTDVELLIDHKFPSQRWNKAESDNPNYMSSEQISQKFQLLSNQTNMWKSRYCDHCVKTGKRGDFMGVKWYYQGTENWEGDPYSEAGCIGCPWYDLEEWKTKLLEIVNKK